MKKVLLLVVVVSLLFVACQTPPEEPQPAVARIEEPAPAAPSAPHLEETPVVVVVETVPTGVDEEDEEYFDASTITQQERDLTMAEVQAMISNLNYLISSKDFYGWVANLLASYYEKINSPAFLKEINDSDQLRSQKIVLKSAEDYFMYVVVPARNSERADDIEFITHTRIKVYTIKRNARTRELQRLRLYDLQKTEDGWKISN